MISLKIDEHCGFHSVPSLNAIQIVEQKILSLKLQLVHASLPMKSLKSQKVFTGRDFKLQ